MEKSVLETFVNAVKAAECETYDIRFEGGNRVATNNSEGSILSLADDAVIAIEVKNNYADKKGVFNVKCIPYDNIDDAGVTGMTVAQVIKFCEEYGVELTDEIKTLIAARGGRVSITPSDGNVKFKEDGTEEIKEYQFPRITVG